MRQQLQTQTYQLSSEFNMDFQRKLGETSFLEHKSNQTMMSFYPHTTSHFFPSEEDHFWWEISIMLLLRETDTKSWSCYELIQIWSYVQLICSIFSRYVSSGDDLLLEYTKRFKRCKRGAFNNEVQGVQDALIEAMICFWWTPPVQAAPTWWVMINGLEQSKYEVQLFATAAHRCRRPYRNLRSPIPED